MKLDAEIESWARSVGSRMFYEKGASSRSALNFARLYGYAFSEGLNPTVTRIYSTGAHQKQLQARYDSGDHMGLRVRPATTSKHIREFNGEMASDAMDMPCSSKENDFRCAQLARQIGLRAGMDFREPDPGHYDTP
jgi:hypothetical protein